MSTMALLPGRRRALMKAVAAAAAEGETEAVLEAGARLGASRDWREAALCAAARNGRLEACEALLGLGADPAKARQPRKGEEEGGRRTLRDGSVDWTPTHAASALGSALLRGQTRCARLLASRVEPGRAFEDGAALGLGLWGMAVAGGELEGLEIALELAGPPRPGKGGFTALMQAAQGGRVEVVRWLLRFEDPNALGADDDPYVAQRGARTALHWAVVWGKLECVELLAPLTDPRAAASTGQTALESALERDWGQAALLRALLPHCDLSMPGAAERGSLVLRAEACAGGPGESWGEGDTSGEACDELALALGTANEEARALARRRPDLVPRFGALLEREALLGELGGEGSAEGASGASRGPRI